jgi:hypothetical protein
LSKILLIACIVVVLAFCIFTGRPSTDRRAAAPGEPDEYGKTSDELYAEQFPRERGRYDRIILFMQFFAFASVFVGGMYYMYNRGRMSR